MVVAQKARSSKNIIVVGLAKNHQPNTIFVDPCKKTNGVAQSIGLARPFLKMVFFYKLLNLKVKTMTRFGICSYF